MPMRSAAPLFALGVLIGMGVPGCSSDQPTIIAEVRSDVAALGKLVTLRPVPLAARWSVAQRGKDEMFGAADTLLSALLRYSDADFASVAHALEGGGRVPSNRDRGQHAVSRAEETWFSAAPFASDLYPTGVAQTLPGRRVLLRLYSR